MPYRKTTLWRNTENILTNGLTGLQKGIKQIYEKQPSIKRKARILKSLHEMNSELQFYEFKKLLKRFGLDTAENLLSAVRAKRFYKLASDLTLIELKKEEIKTIQKLAKQRKIDELEIMINKLKKRLELDKGHEKSERYKEEKYNETTSREGTLNLLAESSRRRLK